MELEVNVVGRWLFFGFEVRRSSSRVFTCGQTDKFMEMMGKDWELRACEALKLGKGKNRVTLQSFFFVSF